ncbi:hypothetical protein GCK32_009383, partial [Trichostrongylus colubriformis]
MDWRAVIVTYNVNMQRGDEDDIEKLLAPSIAVKPSLLVIGMQPVGKVKTVFILCQQFLVPLSGATFWLGDLNFRVEQKEPEEVEELVRAKAFVQLLNTSDQLKQAMRQKEAFDGFEEQPISFPPTYRFYVGSTEYDLKRTPSWCDRILYTGDIIKPVSYISNENVLVSDHLPVQGVFDLEVPTSNTSNWDVLFEHLPPWYTTVP